MKKFISNIIIVFIFYYGIIKSIRCQELNNIPVINIKNMALLSISHKEYAKLLMKSANKLLTPSFFWFANIYSKKFLKKTNNPYLSEIKQISKIMNSDNIYTLNLLYEWGCTSGVSKPNVKDGIQLLRVLDWPLKGLGKYVVIAHKKTPNGDYYNITWPGFVGVINAMAPGRFAAAINRAPTPNHNSLFLGDWIKNRHNLYKSNGLPPAHLLRNVFEKCKTYEEAKEMLCKTHICYPVIFTLSGINEGCVIERTENEFIVHQAPVSIANEWINSKMSGRIRGTSSKKRRKNLEKVLEKDQQISFSWLSDPLLNSKTKLTMIANVKKGILIVQGWENKKPITKIFNLDNFSSKNNS